MSQRYSRESIREDAHGAVMSVRATLRDFLDELGGFKDSPPLEQTIDRLILMTGEFGRELVAWLDQLRELDARREKIDGDPFEDAGQY